MSDKDLKDKPFTGYNKRSITDSVLTYEIWENFSPDKVINRQKSVYFPDILSAEQLATLVPFWQEVGTELNDPVFSLQMDKNGGSTILYRFIDDRGGSPPNSNCEIIKPIMEKGIEKMILADDDRSTFVLHTPINGPSFANDIKDFLKIIDDDKTDEDYLKNHNIQEEMFANTFTLDRRINK